MSRQLALAGLEQPDVSLLSSALVKSIRLRRTEDAIGWLARLWAFPSLRYRVSRRILISSAEDGMSPELIQVVGRWFGGPHRISLPHAAREVRRICQTPSWWALPEGHQYMSCWRRAEFIAEALPQSSFDGCATALDRAMRLHDLLGALAVFTRMSVMPEFLNLRLADHFAPHIEQSEDRRAVALFDCWRGLAPILGRDTNVSGQLLYMLLGGRLPRLTVPPTELNDVVPLSADWELREPPVWANDGIHARADGPIDRRFAGLVGNFVAMANAYAYYGRLDPNDPWRPEFFSVRD